MSRETDYQWFERNRKQLAEDHLRKWIVVHDAQVVAEFDSEERAVVFSIEKHGIDVASVFFADLKDPLHFA